MSEDNPLPQTETLTATAQPSRSQMWKRMFKFRFQKILSSVPRLRFSHTGHLLVGAIALAAAFATTKNSNFVQLQERHIQTSFFDIRGGVDFPDNAATAPGGVGILILAIDGDSMTQGTQIYPSDPSQYSYLAPIERWPWRRTAYAIAIDRLMQAGARAVVLDIVLDAPSSYGPEDDERLRQVLRKYPGRVTLAAQYLDEVKRTGSEIRLLTPNPIFQEAALIGFINFYLSPDGRIHELGSEYLKRVVNAHGDLGAFIPRAPALAEATLKAAQVSYPPPKGENIFFYGPSRTVEQVPFWHVLDPTNWNNYHLKNQTFKNKIVLIGPTTGGELFQDFHEAPFSSTLRYPEKMAGVEIQANAIATLMEGKAIAHAFSDLWVRGGVVLVIVLLAGFLQTRTSRHLRRFGYGLVIALLWGVISYSVFVRGLLILPTAVPMIAIVLTSSSYLFVGVISERLRMLQAARQHRGSEQVREFLSSTEQEDLVQVVDDYKQELLGRKLRGRYKVVDDLGAGGQGQTYLAQDIDRPGYPACVVKRLRPAYKGQKFMRIAESLFQREAVALEKLGKHDQIPQLLAYFEENNDFYLVQEYVEGKSLADELKLHNLLRPINEQKVVMILHELLQILEFVHQQGVIHRDIKPANVIRRKADGKLVLIDFGAVKQVEKLEETLEGTALTVAIGTQGYMAPEQAIGRPCPASDIYALGMTGLRSLTGLEPSELDKRRDQTTHELSWQENVQVSHTFAEILNRMVCFNLADRYQSAREVLIELAPLAEYAQNSDSTITDAWGNPMFLSPEEEEAITEETKPWLEGADIELPPTDADNVVDMDAHELPPTDLATSPSLDNKKSFQSDETKPWLEDE